MAKKPKKPRTVQDTTPPGSTAPPPPYEGI